MKIGPGSTGWVTSHRALHHVHLRRLRRCLLPLLSLRHLITLAPSILPIAAASVSPFVLAPSEPARVVAAAAPAPAPAPAVPAPHVGTPPASRALSPFHEDSSLWPYLCASLDDCDDIVELDFANTSALSDVNAFECRRRCGRNDAKHSKTNRARERNEIERSWDMRGNSITPDLDPGLSHAPAISGRPSQLQAHLAVGGARGSAAASLSPHSQSGAGSCVNPSQPNNSASVLAKYPRAIVVRWRNGNSTPVVQQQQIRVHGQVLSKWTLCQSANSSHDAGSD